MPMKRFLIIAAPAALTAAILLPSAASAQVAAGTVPNTFDRPASAAPATPTQASPQTATGPMSPTPANEASEASLRTIIASLQAGTPDYSLLTEGLATQMRAQASTIVPLIQGFGTIQSFDFVGSRDGADMFVVNFANAETQWIVGMEDSGKIAALLFRPAEGSTPSTTTPPPAQ